MSIPVEPKRGFVHKIRLDFSDRLARPRERHMVVVVQKNDMLKQAKDINVVKITSNIKYVNARYNVFLPPHTISDKQPDPSKIECHALYCVPRNRLLNGEYCGKVPDNIMKEIDDAIIFSLGLLEIE